MRLGYLLANILPFVALGQAQSSSNWCDPENKICFQRRIEPVHSISFASVFPTDTKRNEFIGEIIASKTLGWVGWALGGGMIGDLLIITWINGDKFVSSPRMATTYSQPQPYAGPVVTQLPASKMNSTHWKFVFRCQNCTTWASPSKSGGIAADTQVHAFATTTYDSVSNKSNPASSFMGHTDYGFWSHSVNSARSSSYDTYLGTTTAKEEISSDTTTWTEPSSTATPTETSTTSTTPAPTVSATPYDYIIVGAGPAGLVVADRLSEAGKKVLLVERGGPSTKNSGGTREVAPWANTTGLTRFDVPGLFENMFGSDNPWWWCDDVSVFAGCLVGGGTVINGMLYYPPPDSEFAAEHGWPAGWRNPKPAIDKLLKRLPSYDITSSDGKRYLDQVYDLLKPHFIKLGYKEVTINDDRNKKDMVFGHPAYNFNDGIRRGPTATYLQSAKARPNFTLLTWTNALSLVRNGTRVTGVLTNNTLELPNGLATLSPKGRVVLSAGVYGTSRLLFQSGIGPEDMIQVVQGSERSTLLPEASQFLHLPIGEQVSDNPSINIVFTHPNVDDYDNWQPIWTDPRPEDAAQYVANQSGVFAASSPRFNFWRTIEGSDGKVRYMQGTSRPGGWPTTNQTFNETAVFTITFYLSQGVTSRGRIGIDAALKGKPLVNPWFADPVDKAVLLQGIRETIAGINETLPGIVTITPDNTTTLEEFIDAYDPASMNSNHWVGSTRLGTNRNTSVVDTNTKVWGTDNLFIVDAGIIPGQPMSNVHASIMTVAEMAVPKILALPGGA